MEVMRGEDEGNEFGRWEASSWDSPEALLAIVRRNGFADPVERWTSRCRGAAAASSSPPSRELRMGLASSSPATTWRRRSASSSKPADAGVVGRVGGSGGRQRVDGRHAGSGRRLLRRTLVLRMIEATDGQSISYARNAGVRAARSVPIAICDGDDVVAPGGWWPWARRSRSRPGCRPVGGRPLNPPWLATTRGVPATGLTSSRASSRGSRAATTDSGGRSGSELEASTSRSPPRRPSRTRNSACGPGRRATSSSSAMPLYTTAIARTAGHCGGRGGPTVGVAFTSRGSLGIGGSGSPGSPGGGPGCGCCFPPHSLCPPVASRPGRGSRRTDRPPRRQHPLPLSSLVSRLGPCGSCSSTAPPGGALWPARGSWPSGSGSWACRSTSCRDRRAVVSVCSDGFKRLENVAAHLDETRLAGFALAHRRPAGSWRCPGQAETDRWEWRSPVPGNAGAALARRLESDVVVASVLRPQWRKLCRDLRRSRIASVLYLREDTAIEHLAALSLPTGCPRTPLRCSGGPESAVSSASRSRRRSLARSCSWTVPRRHVLFVPFRARVRWRCRPGGGGGRSPGVSFPLPGLVELLARPG